MQKNLRAIDDMTSTSDLPAVLGELQKTLDQGGLFFNFSSNQDFADSSKVIAFAAAGGGDERISPDMGSTG
jgi:endothelin-converting enzyme/putative endopeptidase